MKSPTNHRNRHTLPLACAVAATALIVVPHPAHAWTSNGVALSSGTGATQVLDVRTVADGAGGAYVVWDDNRTGNLDVYALRITSQGTVAANWPANGRAVTNVGGDQLSVQAVADGTGGLLMCWEDHRHGAGNADIYAQRFTSDGNRAPGWIADGLPVCTADNDQKLPSLISDNAGGAIVVWYDYRPPHFNAGTPVAYAQRVTPTCNTSWTTDGIVVSTATLNSTTSDLDVASDGAGGAIVTWSNGWMFGQHLGPTGSLSWTSSGIQLTSINSASATSAPDGRGGAYIAYATLNAANNTDIYVQHVDSAGNRASDDGFALSTADGNQSQPSIASDGNSGAVVAWLDDRFVGGGIYAGKVMASGVASCFAVNGTKVSGSTGNVNVLQVQAESQGGILLTWSQNGTQILAQRVLASGVVDPNLPAGGTVMVDNGSSFANGPSLAWTASGQAIDAWYDARSGVAVYANQFTFGTATPASISLAVGGTGRHSALLNWTVPAADPIYGAPTAFEVRYSGSSIGNANWTAATYSEVVLALSPGSNQCAEVDGLTPCHTYYLGVRAIYCGAFSSASNSPSGVTTCSGNTEVTCGDGVRWEPGTDASTIGDQLDLRVPSPNPASGSCSFGITIPARSTSKARLEILDVAGRVVRSLPDPAVGSHDLKWDLRGDDGRRVSSGVYWVRIQLAGETRSRMLLVRE